MSAPTFQLSGKSYVVIEREEYDRLTVLAKAAGLPALPDPDADGNYPAVEYARASLARKIIRDRVKVGLSQRQLALRAGVRVETLCRIETGKHTASVATIQKLDKVLTEAERAMDAKRPRRTPRRATDPKRR